jgi:hypothetical protein
VSNYVKNTDYAVKDGLLSGNPNKIIKGTELDEEFNDIATAISTKADLVSPTFTGTPAAPTASPGTNTTQVATTAFAVAASAAAFPVGGIIMWSGTIATIPIGWALCNGSNGTPDLRDRFIIGARQDDGGASKTNVTGSLTQTGGSKDAIVVSHTHTATTSITDPQHSHITGTGIESGFDLYGTTGSPTTHRTANILNSAGVRALTSSSTTGITASTSISTVGSSGTNANLPPYYALAFIMKTA